MKILFVWDVAGVSCVQAKYLRKRGHICNVMMRKSYDGFGFIDFYKEISLDADGNEFDNWAIRNAEVNDIIHVNSDYQLAYRIKKEYPDKKVILEYHGSDVRLTPIKDREMWERPLDKILVSTPDLLDYGIEKVVEWLPITIDREHFKVSKHSRGALFIKPHDQELPPTDTPYNIHVVLRDVTPWKYSEMPRLFKLYNTYIDIRKDKDVGYMTALSKTALEALSTGMQVYTHDKRIITELPKWHEPETVITQLEAIYNSL